MTSINAVSSASTAADARVELVKAQQKLATDVAAKAAAKVIAEDKTAVVKTQKAVTEAQQSGGLDVTV